VADYALNSLKVEPDAANWGNRVAVKAPTLTEVLKIKDRLQVERGVVVRHAS
jgi:hypothetical protein